MDEATGLGALFGGMLAAFALVYVAIIVVMIASLWKIFTKAGKPGWACIIPLYNIFVMCEIAGRPGWWLVLLLVPLVNFVIGILLVIDLAKSFGKSTGFALGMIFLSPVFYPMLAFGDARYLGPAALNRA